MNACENLGPFLACDFWVLMTSVAWSRPPGQRNSTSWFPAQRKWLATSMSTQASSFNHLCSFFVIFYEFVLMLFNLSSL